MTVSTLIDANSDPVRGLAFTGFFGALRLAVSQYSTGWLASCSSVISGMISVT